jgi:hypothetical protein
LTHSAQYKTPGVYARFSCACTRSPSASSEDIVIGNFGTKLHSYCGSYLSGFYNKRAVMCYICAKKNCHHLLLLSLHFLRQLMVKIRFTGGMLFVYTILTMLSLVV